jgi:hypothetical protein
MEHENDAIARVALNAIQNDRVAIGKVVADTGNIEAVINEAVAVGALLSFPLSGALPMALGEKLQELLARRRTRQQAIEVARAASLHVVVRFRPHLVEKGLHREGLKQPG